MQVIKRAKHDIYPYIFATHRLAGAASGKSILITGGGKGIGKAIAKQYALAGAKTIWITGRSHDALENAKSEIKAASSACNIQPVVADITSQASVDDFFTTIAPEVPDVLVNNAGAASSQVKIADSNPQTWWSDFDINVKGLYFMTRAYLGLLSGRPGTVINVSSSVADLVSPNMSSYGTSKLAVNRFTECIQLEYGGQGVNAFAFHPGGIAETGMGQQAPKQFRHRLIDTIDLAAGTALYLSTPEARYLAGRFVYANWDMEAVQKLESEIVNKDLLKARIDYGDVLSVEVIGLPPS